MTVSNNMLFHWFATGFIFATALCELTDKSTLCRLKSEVSYDEVLKIHENKLAETHEGKCYTACLFQENKIMINGKIAPEAVPAVLDERKQITKRQKRKWNFKVKKCADTANVEQDECESAFKFMKCLLDEALDCTAEEDGASAESERTISIKLPETINLMIPPLRLPPFNLVLFMLG